MLVPLCDPERRYSGCEQASSADKAIALASEQDNSISRLITVLLFRVTTKFVDICTSEYISTGSHDYIVCRQIKDMVEINCHLDKSESQKKCMSLRLYSFQ